jgi:hypothetical protein
MMVDSYFFPPENLSLLIEYIYSIAEFFAPAKHYYGAVFKTYKYYTARNQPYQQKMFLMRLTVWRINKKYSRRSTKRTAAIESGQF